MWNRHVPGTLLILVALSTVPHPAPAADRPARPAPSGLVRAIHVQPDKAPDCTSLKSIVESVTRECRTNDEKAIALYNFMRLTHYHRAYPGEPGGTPVLKEIHCYGWSLCGGLHAEQSALWRELGWNWRFVGWPGHTTVEAYYDGRWHYLDVFLKLYAWMPDPRDPSRQILAGQDDLAAHADTLLENALVFDPARNVSYVRGNEFSLVRGRANWQAPAFLVCGDELPGIIATLRQRKVVGPSTGWEGIQHATGDYSAEVHLAPGWGLTNTWDPIEGAWYWTGSRAAPCHTCGDKGYRNSPEKGPIVEPYREASRTCESYANGQLTFRPDFRSADCLAGFVRTENLAVTDGTLGPADASRPGQAILQMKSPYLFTQAGGKADGIAECEISVDGGQTWKTAEFSDFGNAVAGRLEAWIRLTLTRPIAHLELTATVQNNPFALPYLSPGKNRIRVSLPDPGDLGDRSLVVTYAYRPGSRSKSYEQLLLEGKEIARGHAASWESTPTVVQKTFRAADLPATFDIDIPTPQGKTPVFPRMLFVRREILAPGQSPLPIPESQPPRRDPGDVLVNVPNPLMTGIAPPSAAAQSTVRTVTHVLREGEYATRSGKPPANGALRWPKVAGESVDPAAYLVRGALPKLPPLESVVRARLKFLVSGAHDQAPARLGVCALKDGEEHRPSLRLEALGATLGSVVVPVQAVGGWTEREIELDVTRYIQSVIAGTTHHHGFAWRVLPDRSIDDGWTVRVQLPPAPRIVLELDLDEAPDPASGGSQPMPPR